MIRQNTALVIQNTQNYAVKRHASFPVPSEQELLIQVLYSGINPADVKHEDLGIDTTTLGYDFCGQVMGGHDVETVNMQFKEGDIVAGYTPTGIGRPSKFGSHQDYLVCPVDMMFKVPDNVPRSHAACLTVTTMTAADIVFNLFGLHLSDENKLLSHADAILIWGAAGGVGSATVQFAKIAGFKHILAVASIARHHELKLLGATACFEYKQPDAVDKIRTHAKKHNFKISYGVDAVGTIGQNNSADMVRRSCHADAQLVSTVLRSQKTFKLPFAMKNRDIQLKVHAFVTPRYMKWLQPWVPKIKVSLSRNEGDHQKAWQALMYAVGHYGQDFHRMSSVQECSRDAEQALDKVKAVAAGTGGSGKWVVPHPFA
jgi:NADPH:quinone reductase-like Zn-dependent oxidoreductase